MSARSPIKVRVQAIRYEAEGILSFELRPLDGRALPTFTAGAHIEILMKEDLERSYSLINPQVETHRYVVAVGKDPQSRGGSEFMCGTLRPGDELQIAGPGNNFELDETAKETVLIA